MYLGNVFLSFIVTLLKRGCKYEPAVSLYLVLLAYMKIEVCNYTDLLQQREKRVPVVSSAPHLPPP